MLESPEYAGLYAAGISPDYTLPPPGYFLGSLATACVVAFITAWYLGQVLPWSPGRVRRQSASIPRPLDCVATPTNPWLAVSSTRRSAAARVVVLSLSVLLVAE